MHAMGGAAVATVASPAGPLASGAGAGVGVAAGEIAYQNWFNEEESDEDGATLGDIKKTLGVARGAHDAVRKVERLTFLAIGIGVLGTILGWWGSKRGKKK